MAGSNGVAAALNRFNGQWGFALWDTQAESLVLSVDPYGIRPVFYHEGTNGILFASEIKAIFQDASIPRRMDPAGLSAVYVTWGLVDEHTCFDKIHRVVPGHYVEFSSAGKRSVPYRAKSLSEPGEMKNLDPEELHRTLLDAVNLRFTRSDVPVGGLSVRRTRFLYPRIFDNTPYEYQSGDVLHSI